MKKAYPGTGILRWCITALLWVLITVIPADTEAQQVKQKPARILFLLDASSSMLTGWTTSETRFQTAARLVSAIVDSIHAVNPDVAFAVRVFGNQYPAQEKNCYDTRLEVPFNLGNDGQIRARLKYLTPRGFSPIAWSLKETAEKDFTESEAYSYSIILITDGGESCGGDICATVTNLLSKKISFKPYILSLVDYEPLKLQYACLGKYLTVARETDIVPAINTIIADNRKVLTIKTTGLKRVQQEPVIPVAVPATVKPATPVIKLEPEVVKATPVPVKKDDPPKAVAPDVPVVLPKVTPFDRIAGLTKLRRMNLLYTLPEGMPVAVPPLSRIKIVVEEEPKPQAIVSKPSPATVKPVTPASTAPYKANTLKTAIVEPSGTTKPNKTATSRTVKPAEKKEEKMDFVVKTEDAKESTLQIYFTNGQGKFYRTEPHMLIKDSKTGKEVKNLYRNLTNGEPDPIKLQPGTYDIIIPGSKSKATGITIEPGKNKKYYFRISTGSLAFYYPSAPDRPVKEYLALVSKRFEQGPVVKQKCDEELPYDPANYHIEINTLPAMILNVDLEFNNVKLMSIPEPGSVQIANTDRLGKVQFWYQHGDTYVPFYEMQVQGNAAAQKVDFLPGLYQVRYFRGPSGPLAKADVVLFRVKSNMTTTIELEK